MLSTVTVFSTVGFGDITAKTEAARLVVAGQIIADLITIGLAVRVIVGAVKQGPPAAARVWDQRLKPPSQGRVRRRSGQRECLLQVPARPVPG